MSPAVMSPAGPLDCVFSDIAAKFGDPADVFKHAKPWDPDLMLLDPKTNCRASIRWVDMPAASSDGEVTYWVQKQPAGEVTRQGDVLVGFFATAPGRLRVRVRALYTHVDESTMDAGDHVMKAGGFVYAIDDMYAAPHLGTGGGLSVEWTPDPCPDIPLGGGAAAAGYHVDHVWAVYAVLPRSLRNQGWAYELRDDLAYSCGQAVSPAPAGSVRAPRLRG
jgi:hypothetical protein